MHKISIDELTRWCCDVTGEQFVEQIYDRTLEEDAGGYAIGKFKQMQNNTICWMSNLDDFHKNRLAIAIINHWQEVEFQRLCHKIKDGLEEING